MMAICDYAWVEFELLNPAGVPLAVLRQEELLGEPAPHYGRGVRESLAGGSYR